MIARMKINFFLIGAALALSFGACSKKPHVAAHEADLPPLAVRVQTVEAMAGEIASLLISRMAVPVLYCMANAPRRKALQVPAAKEQEPKTSGQTRGSPQQPVRPLKLWTASIMATTFSVGVQA